MRTVQPIPLVLEDADGKVIRSFNWTQDKMVLVRKIDTGRLEALPSDQVFADSKANFTVIKSVDVSELRNKVTIPSIGYLRRLHDGDKVEFYTIKPLKDHDEENFKKSLRISGIIHAILIFLGISAFWAQETFFKKEEVVVKIEIPKTIPLPPPEKPREVVQAATQKIDRKQKVAPKKVKTKTVVTKKTTPVKKSVNNVGALAALGGTLKGSKSGSGLNLNSALKYTGSGDSAGTKSLGHATTAFAGKGLSANSGGGGSTDLGQVGYGTRGRSGGQAGYGKLNIGGGSGGYEHPMQEEGTSDGGLEMSQIEAVIKRNIGQIYYCYEKGLQSQPQLSGRVFTNFIIGGSGRVQMAQVGRSSLQSASVEQCMVGKIKGWKFPTPHGNVDVNVSYPFTLKRAKGV